MSHRILRWVTGLLLAVSFSLAGFEPTLAAVPANDNFANAQIITLLPFTTSVDNTEASTEPGEPQGCGFPYKTVWFSFTPAQNTPVQIDISGSPNGGVVNLFLASGPLLSDLTSLACAATGSPINFHLEAGKTYFFRVDSFGGPSVLQLTIDPLSPPANDNFVDAQAITTLPFSTDVNNTNATFELNEPEGCGFLFRSAWYAYTPTRSMALRLNVTGSSFRSVAGIFVASGGSISDLTALSCAYNNTFANVQVEAGKTYYVRVDTSGQPELIHLSLEEIIPPSNDNFADAEAIPSIPYAITVDNTNATTETDEPSACGSLFRSVWYSFTPPANIDIRMDALDSLTAGTVSIYRANGSGILDLTFLTCASVYTSTRVQLEGGATYYLRVDSWGGGGLIQVHLNEAIPPTNDDFANAEAIPSLPFSGTADISNATIEPDEPQPCIYTQNSVWYSFTATETTALRADAEGSSAYASVNVYRDTGNGIAGLELMVCSYYGSSALFNVEAGKTYMFQVASSGQLGTVQLNLTKVAPIKGRITDAVTGTPLRGDIEPYTVVFLHQICGVDCVNYIASQQTNSEGQFSFDSDSSGRALPVGSYQITASAYLYLSKSFGPFEFHGASLDVGDLALDPPAVIRGRVVDSTDANPISGAYVRLHRCGEDGCFEYINSQDTDGDGNFSFDSFYYGNPLDAGTYEVDIFSPAYMRQRIRVIITNGEDHNMGDVLMEPVARIGSISGRVVDAVSGQPISTSFFPSMYLMRCDEDGCAYMTWLTLDSTGLFRFETDDSGNRLIAGSYRIVAYASQYEYAQTDLFQVEKDEHFTLPDIKVKSYPVRFSDLQPCPDIPASGGECVFTVKVSNGTATSLVGKVWSMADGSLPGSLIGYTYFQIKDPQELDLAKGQSKIFRFRFSVPANPGPYGTSMCSRILVGEGSQPYLNTIGFRELFCVYWDAGGFSIVSPPEGMTAPRSSVNVSQMGAEVEPNNSCQGAQDVGDISSPFSLSGNLDSSEAPDVDFFRFTGTPGRLFSVDLEGNPTGKGSLPDPYLGFFDSNCNLMSANDDYTSLNSHLEIMVPDDGSFVLAATECCDSSFGGGGNGTYQLSISSIQLVGSIGGVVTDALTGNTLPGDTTPYAFVRLDRCDEYGCSAVNSQNAESDGSFRFETDFYGQPLRAGEYRVFAFAEQYHLGETAVFTVEDGEDYNIGSIPLASYPVRFGDIQPCSVSARGGLCDFSVKVTNGLPAKFSGRAWSVVNGYGLGSFINSTIFQSDSPVEVSLEPGKSTTLRFRFQIRASVANGAAVCPIAYVGQNPSPLFNTVGQRYLFCFVKESDGFRLMSEQEMHSRVQHMHLNEVAPAHGPFLPKK